MVSLFLSPHANELRTEIGGEESQSLEPAKRQSEFLTVKLSRRWFNNENAVPVFVNGWQSGGNVGKQTTTDLTPEREPQLNES